MRCLVYLLLLCAHCLSAQDFNANWVPAKVLAGFLSGGTDGMTQVISFHPDRFFAAHPNADRQFWDNEISWRNKYKNGDKTQGPAFFGSTTFLAPFTDGYHLMRTTSRYTAVVGISIPLYEGSGKKIQHYLAEAGLFGAGYIGGFHFAYTLMH